MAGNMSHEQHVQEDFRQRIAAQGEAQRNNLSSEVSVIGQSVRPRVMAVFFFILVVVFFFSPISHDTVIRLF